MEASLRQRVLRAMEASPLWAAFSKEVREHLGTTARWVDLPARRWLWRWGEPAEHVALVERGRMKVARPSTHRDVVLDFAVPPDVVGEQGLVADGAYAADVVSVRPSCLAVWPCREVRGALEQEPRAALALAQDLARQNVRLADATVGLCGGKVEQRLAQVLVQLADRSGQPLAGGILISPRLGRKDLAAMAATTVETVSRRLGSWEKRGLVRVQPTGYWLPDLDALRDVAEGD